MIKYVIFDLGEVLINGLIGFQHVLKNYIDLPEETIRKQLMDQSLTPFFCGEISEDKFWQILISKNNWPLSVTFLKFQVRKRFTEIKGTREFIKDIKNLGFTIALLSVHAREWIEYIEIRHGILHLFNEVSFSFEAGIKKPNPLSYQIILTKLGAKPEECIFIDDSTVNTAAAEALGIKSITFINAEQTRHEFEEIVSQ